MAAPISPSPSSTRAAEAQAAIATAIGRVASRLASVRGGQPADASVMTMPAIADDDPIVRLVARAAPGASSAGLIDALRLLAAGEGDPIAHRDLLRIGFDPTRAGVEIGALVTVAEYLGRSGAAIAAALAPDAPLVARGLVELTRDEGPLIGRRVALAPRVLDALGGRLAGDAAAPTRLLPLAIEPAANAASLVIAIHVAERARAALTGDRPLWLAGVRGVGKRTLLAALAAERDQRLITIELRDALGRNKAELIAGLWREALLLDAIVCVANVAEHPNDAPRAIIALYEAMVAAGLPVVFTSATAPTLGDFDHPPLVQLMPMPAALARVELWRRLLPDVVRLDEAAARYRLPPGRIVRVAAAAAEAGRLEARTVEPIDVTRAVSAEVAQKVTVLGTKIEDAQGWDDIVLPASTMDAVKEIVSRARWRHKVLHEWGFERKLAKGLGLSALFSGAPGTGKTMVAGIIARELALELYQIDLSRVVSKYVGETEKNLAEVFEAADWGNVLLLFDEADALFSKRTEVKSSNDRFANMETNYLLQRLERFEGVSILTTNLEGSIDSAFKRRLTFRVNFPLPDQAERELLWRRMVPREATLAEPLDFAELAARYELTGGNIRNAMLRAAFLAAGDGQGITLDHVHRAVVLEYHDAGQIAIGGKLSQ